MVGSRIIRTICGKFRTTGRTLTVVVLLLISFVLVPVVAVAGYSVKVVTNIGGASVHMDGSYKCTTSWDWWELSYSCTISGVSGGTHKFEAKKYGYNTATTWKYIYKSTKLYLTLTNTPPYIGSRWTEPSSPTTLDFMTIKAYITDNSAVSEAKVYYKPPGDWLYSSKTMYRYSGSYWKASIGKSPRGYLYYYIWAKDNLGAISKSSTSSVFVKDGTAPIIVNHEISHSPSNPTTDDNVFIRAGTIYDTDSGISKVTLYYKRPGSGSYSSKSMSEIFNLDPNDYGATIYSSELSQSGTLSYYVKAWNGDYITSRSSTRSFYLTWPKYDVTVYTNQDSAFVYMDGSYKCKTSWDWFKYSCKIHNVPKGDHNFKVTKYGYEDASTSKYISKNDRTVTLDLYNPPPNIGTPWVEPTTPTTTTSVTIRVRVTDNSVVSSVTLHYKEPGLLWGTSASMSKSGDVWSKNIGICGRGTLEYSLEASDNLGKKSNTQIYYQFIADGTPPVGFDGITATPNPSFTEDTITITVNTAYDPDSGIDYVRLYYKLPGTVNYAWKNMYEPFDLDWDNWRAHIESSENSLTGDISYYVVAKNNDGLEIRSLTRSISAYGRYVVLLGNVLYQNQNSGMDEPVRDALIEVYDAATGYCLYPRPRHTLNTGVNCLYGDYGIVLKTGNSGQFSLGPFDNKAGTGTVRRFLVRVNSESDAAVIRNQNGNRFTFESREGSSTSSPLDMGAVGPPAANNGAWHILDSIWYGHRLISLFADAPSQVAVRWFIGYEPQPTTHYNFWTNTIHLLGNWDHDEWDFSVIVHEYGHFIMDTYADNGPGGSHQCNQDTGSFLAYSEGWATFLQSAAKGGFGLPNPSQYVDAPSGPLNLETHQRSPTDELLDECAVSGILWDIYDSSNQLEDQDGDGVGDSLSLGFNPIWDVFDNYDPVWWNPLHNHPHSLTEFWDGWFSRGHGNRPELNAIYWEHGIDMNKEPTATTLSPNGGGWISGRVTLLASASEQSPIDGEVKRVRFEYSIDPNQGPAVCPPGDLDNMDAWCTIGEDASSSGGWSIIWDTSSITWDSSVWVRVRAFDGMEWSSWDSSDSSFEIRNYPELGISDNDISFSDVTPDTGQILFIEASVHNTGYGPGAATIAFFDGQPSSGSLLESTTTTIGEGDTRALVIAWDLTGVGGRHTVCVEIQDVSPLELDDTDNLACQEIVIGLTFYFKSGKNMISFPLITWTSYRASTYAAEIAAQGGTVTKIERYDATSDDYKVYIPGVSPPSDDFPMVADEGYNVYVTGDADLRITGDAPSTRTVSLVDGWNFIGFTELSPIRASQLASRIGSKCKSVNWYNPAIGGYETYITGLSGPEHDFTIRPGYGLLIYMNGSGSIIYN